MSTWPRSGRDHGSGRTPPFAALVLGLAGATFLWATDGGVLQPDREVVLGTGWLAVGLLIAAGAYSWRRRVAKGAKGRLDAWLQGHSLVGGAAAVVALLHAALGSAGGLGTMRAGAASGALLAVVLLAIGGMAGRWFYEVAPRSLARRQGQSVADARLVEELLGRLRAGKSAMFLRATDPKARMLEPSDGTRPAIPPDEADDLRLAEEATLRLAALRSDSVGRGTLDRWFRAFSWSHVALTIAGAVLVLGHVADAGWRGSPADSATGAVGVGSPAWPSARECRACHAQIVDEWSTSPHSAAGASHFTQQMNHAAEVAAGAPLNATCLGCHAPVAAQLGLATTGSAWTQWVAGVEPERPWRLDGCCPAAAAEGVTCVACHASPHVGGGDVPLGTSGPPWDMGDFRAAAGGPGPVPVRNEGHRTARTELVGSSELCQRCHNVTIARPTPSIYGAVDQGAALHASGRPWRVVLQETHDEWAASAYAAKGVQCQDCHMPDASHAFIGPDSALVNDVPKERVAAEVAKAVSTTLEWGQTGAVEVTVHNVGAGHDFPTGFTFERELWLEVVGWSGAREVFRSGWLDTGGRLVGDTAERSLEDPYLLLLRSRLVTLTREDSGLVGDDGALDVPAALLAPFRNANGTLVLPETGDLAPVREVALQTQADGVVKEGIRAGGVHEASYPLPPDADRARVRLLMRPLTPRTVHDVLGMRHVNLPIYELDVKEIRRARGGAAGDQ